MKIDMKHLLSICAAALLCAAMVLPVHASYEMDYLFDELLHENEWLLREVEKPESEYESRHERVRRNSDDSSTIWVDTQFVTRKADSSFRVDNDVLISEIIQVVIPEGKTITINAGVTLTIHGQLLIHGKLVNNGTIVIGDSNASTRYNDYEKNPGLSQLLIMGESVNTGAITIANGKLDNTGGATSTNNGTISVTNSHEKLTGLMNSTIKRGDKITGGKFINNGTIDVCNQGGTGLRNQSGADFENKGSIHLSQTATAKGIIGGNKPVRKNN